MPTTSARTVLGALMVAALVLVAGPSGLQAQVNQTGMSKGTKIAIAVVVVIGLVVTVLVLGHAGQED